jgi:hypothetical protein
MKKVIGLALTGLLLTGCKYGYSDEELLSQHFPKDVVENIDGWVTNVEVEDKNILNIKIDEEFIKTKISTGENGWEILNQYFAERLPLYHENDAICSQFTYYDTEREQDINIRDFCYKNE